jgi:hypothetical protein
LYAHMNKKKKKKKESEKEKPPNGRTLWQIMYLIRDWYLDSIKNAYKSNNYLKLLRFR